MPTITARNFFSRRVSITGGAAISLGNLMRAAPAVTGTPAWGTNSDGSKSADAFIGDGASVIPVTENLYVGYDAQVANVDAAATYTGVPAAAGQSFPIQDFTRAPVDADSVWLYSVNTQLVDVIFQGI
jgi:hypothetical protein